MPCVAACGAAAPTCHLTALAPMVHMQMKLVEHVAPLSRWSGPLNDKGDVNMCFLYGQLVPDLKPPPFDIQRIQARRRELMQLHRNGVMLPNPASPPPAPHAQHEAADGEAAAGSGGAVEGAVGGRGRAKGGVSGVAAPFSEHGGFDAWVEALSFAEAKYVLRLLKGHREQLPE